MLRTRFPVYVRAVRRRSYERLVLSLIHGYVAPTDCVEHCECIGGRLVDRLVARHSADAKETQARVLCCQHDCERVIMACKHMPYKLKMRRQRLCKPRFQAFSSSGRRTLPRLALVADRGEEAHTRTGSTQTQTRTDLLAS